MAPDSTLSEIVLPFGERTVSVSVPSRNLIGTYSPLETEPCPSVRAEIRRALESPIGGPSLRDLVRGRRRILIVADDLTRQTPAAEICQELLEQFQRFGIGDDQVEILIALGTHRPMTEGEIFERFGPELRDRLPIHNHPWQEEGSLVSLGKTRNDTPVTVCRMAVEADLVIGLGTIVPHHIPGFSGGAKIIQPGITGAETTGATHLLSTRSESFCLGELENPVRHEIEEIASRVGLSAIVNCVLNRSGELVKAFFGSPRSAFREGAAHARRIYGIRIPSRADVVVAGSCPCDIEFWQAHKSLYPAALSVTPGGTIIVVTPCPEGVSRTHPEMLDYAGRPSAEILRLVELREVSDMVSGALALAWSRVREHAEVFLVSPGISDHEARELGFRPFGSVEDALGTALRSCGSSASILALTHAPDTLPLVGA